MIVIGGTPTLTACLLYTCVLPVGNEIYWSMGPILRYYHLKVDASAILLKGHSTLQPG